MYYSNNSPHFALEYHELLEVLERDLILPRESLFDYSLEVGVEATYREVGVTDGCPEILTREKFLVFSIEEIVGFSEVFCADQHALRYYGRQKLIPMNLAVSININGVEEAPQLLLIIEVGEKELFDIFECDKAVVFFINLKEYLPEPLGLVLVDLAPVSDDVLHALPEEQTLAVGLHAVEGRRRDLALRYRVYVHFKPRVF